MVFYLLGFAFGVIHLYFSYLQFTRVRDNDSEFKDEEYDMDSEILSDNTFIIVERREGKFSPYRRSVLIIEGSLALGMGLVVFLGLVFDLIGWDRPVYYCIGSYFAFYGLWLLYFLAKQTYEFVYMHRYYKKFESEAMEEDNKDEMSD